MSELERTLFSLSRELEVPETPDLVSPVLSRISPRPRRVPLRRLSLALAFVLVALLAATLAIPSARSALFRVFHIGGEEIVRVDRLPSVPPRQRLPLTLGTRVSLAEARRAAGFELRTLDEKPDSVYLDGRTVWLLYGTPARVKLLVAETPNEHVDRVFFEKLAGSGTRVQEIEVDGAPGAFLSGAPHEVILVNEEGFPVVESARLARDVLVWSRDGIAYRLEGDFTRDEALRLARSLQP